MLCSAAQNDFKMFCFDTSFKFRPKTFWMICSLINVTWQLRFVQSAETTRVSVEAVILLRWQQPLSKERATLLS